MAMFNGVGKKISIKGQNVMTKAKGIADITGLKSQISSEEKKIDMYYRNLGKEYYDRMQEEPLPELAELVGMIKASFQKIEEIKANIAEIENVKTCPVCGMILESDMLFCVGCGTKIEQMEKDKPQQGMKYCSSCGASIPEFATFCTKCGAKQN